MAKRYRLKSQDEAKIKDAVRNWDDARKSHSQKQTCSHPSIGWGTEMLHHSNAALCPVHCQ